YIPTLSFVNSTGCFRTLPPIDPIYISEISPDFMASQTVLCSSNNEVSFENISDSMDPFTQVEWIFEGAQPASSTAEQPVVRYENPGSFDVTMIVDNGICRDTLVREDYIAVSAAPEANFGVSVSEGCAPLMVNFTDLSSVTLGEVVEWFWDFGDGTSATIENPTHIFTTGQDFQVNLMVTTAEGCTSTSSQNIRVFPLTPVSAGMDRDVCIGEATQLSGEILGNPQGLSYNWTPSNTLSCSDCLEPIATPEDTTTYTFTVFSQEGCSSSSEVKVNVKPFPVPVIELTADTAICAESILQLQVSGGDNVFSYQWNPMAPGLSCYENCLNPIAQPLNSTTYTVTVTSIQGCSSQDSVAIEVIDAFQPFAGADQTICQGDTAQLTIQWGSDPFWLVNENLSCAYCPDPLANPDQTTDYVAQVVSEEGCTIIDTITVFALGPEDISAGADADVCLGDAIQLSGVGAGNPTWTPSATLDAADILQPEALPDETTTYRLTLENGACTLQDSVTIWVREKVDIAVLGATICQGDSIELAITGNADTYIWEAMAGIEDLDSPNPMVFPNETTTFMVVGTLSSCEADTALVTIEVLPAPDIALRRVYEYFPDQLVSLDAAPRDGTFSDYTYEWFPTTGLSCSDCPNPVIDPGGDNFDYQLRVSNVATGCTQSFDTRVQLLEACPDDLVQLPNVFSPNGDGQNDRLEIFSAPALNDNYDIRIYDRWGAFIFRGIGADAAWDGTYRGEPMASGVYIYQIKAFCPVKNDYFIISGDVTLMR
ncbi:MAG: PKD domain-containing protein, partial [Bacteroidota bacterium]